MQDDKLSRCVARQLHASRQRQQRVRHTPKARRRPSAIPWPLVLTNSIDFGSLSHPHGLEEAPVFHRPGPGHLCEVGLPPQFQFHAPCSIHAQFGLLNSLPWPRRGTCSPLTCPWPPCRCWPTSSLAFSCPLVPSCPIWGLFVIPMA